MDVLYQCNWRNAMILEEYLFLRRRDEIRAEQGAAGYGSTGSTTTRSNPATITASTSNSSGNALKKASGSSRQDNDRHGDTRKKGDISKNVRKNSSGPKPREYATFISIDTRA